MSKELGEKGLEIYLRNVLIAQIKLLIETPQPARPDFDKWFESLLTNIYGEVTTKFQAIVKDARQEVQIILKTNNNDLTKN